MENVAVTSVPYQIHRADHHEVVVEDGEVEAYGQAPAVPESAAAV
jgi:hypothetical protein